MDRETPFLFRNAFIFSPLSLAYVKQITLNELESPFLFLLLRGATYLSSLFSICSLEKPTNARLLANVYVFLILGTLKF